MITVFAMAISFMMSAFLCAYATDDDKNKTFGDNSSSVFSPGYLNAAKYKTETVVNQATHQPGMMENIINYVQGKTGNEIKMEDAVIKMDPGLELKKKKFPTYYGT